MGEGNAAHCMKNGPSCLLRSRRFGLHMHGASTPDQLGVIADQRGCCDKQTKTIPMAAGMAWM